MNSDTPRTDAELKRVADQLDGGEDNAAYVMSQFGAHACMLEREVERLRTALKLAEAALSDIGDADRESGDDVAWCERRAAEPLSIVRSALKETK
jgi:hypothetical protein